MAKKPKYRTPSVLPLAVIQARAIRAMQEGRYQQALELGKQVYKYDPTAQNRDLLRQIYLGRAEQLRKQGYTRDACTLLDNAAQLSGNDPVWLEKIAAELASCGDSRRALDLMQWIPGTEAQARVHALTADSALQQGPAGRNLLPESLRSQYDLIVQAFRQLEAGQDELVKETLQGIGLQSPFLEWKLLLRGLQAYYLKEDLRALENWQRLNPERLPAKLAAPSRFHIDPAFRQAQPPETQAILQKQGDRLQDSGLVQPMRHLQKVLADPEQLPSAFRLAEGMVAGLRQQAPHLVPRLAACFYWAIIDHGQPEDMTRYRRVFGNPLDDPEMFRLQALVNEHIFEMQEAHKYWQKFEQFVASNPAVWPGGTGDRLRALIWCRMGHNAANMPDQEQIDLLPPFLRDSPARPRPLSPSAEECFRRSFQLAPNQLEAHEALFDFYARQGEDAKAERAARELLQQFPDHIPTLEALANLRGHQGDHAESVSLLQHALRVNPLDRSLRSKLGMAHLFHARDYVEAGRFDEARAEYQTVLTFRDGKDESSVYCKWAACEFKAGDSARAAELLQKALADAGNRLAVAFSMVIEIIRLKLPRALKTRFDKEFNAGLAEPPIGQSAAAIAETASAHRLAGVTYHGQKTHEKKVLTYLEKALKAEFTEDQLHRTCTGLLGLEAHKLLRKFTTLGKRRFPANPQFYFQEAESYFAQGPNRCPVWKVQPLLAKARELTQRLPPDDKQKALLELIEQREQMLGAGNFLNNPHARGMLEEMIQIINPEFDDFDEQDDDDFDFEDDF